MGGKLSVLWSQIVFYCSDVASLSNEICNHKTLHCKIKFATIKLTIHLPRYENNQTWVSDADLEIPTLGSRDNAGNTVNLISDIICTSDWDLTVCIGDRR